MQIRAVMMSYCLQPTNGKHGTNDISGNTEAAFPKPGTTNVRHKRNDTLSAVAVANLSVPVSFCQKTKNLHLQPLK